MCVYFCVVVLCLTIVASQVLRHFVNVRWVFIALCCCCCFETNFSVRRRAGSVIVKIEQRHVGNRFEEEINLKGEKISKNPRLQAGECVNAKEERTLWGPRQFGSQLPNDIMARVYRERHRQLALSRAIISFAGLIYFRPQSAIGICRLFSFE